MPLPGPCPHPLAELIDRYRRGWFALIGLLLVVSYNGQWQVGGDSAAYRALGHQLATTGRYYFRELVPGLDEYHNQQGTRYPGLPLVLAGLEKLFGPGAGPPLVFMHLVAGATLVVAYRLMLRRLDRWLAVCVVVGLGTNPRFLQHANEVLSDLPFLFGVMVALLGCDMLFRGEGWRHGVLAGMVTFVGLVIAAAMRPTYMLLMMAVAGACAWGLVAGRENLVRDPSPAPPAPKGACARRRSVMLLVVVACAILFFLRVLDIRTTHAKGIAAGGYESRMLDKFGNFRQKVLPRLADNTGELLENALPTAFLGCRSGLQVFRLGKHSIGLGSAFSLILIAAGAALFRHHLLWGLLIVVTLVSLGLGGPVPRYFLMILPLLLAAWALGVDGVAARFRSTGARVLVTCLGLGLVLVLNFASSADVMLTQWGISRPVDEERHWQGFHHVGFLRAFENGKWASIYDLAALVRRESRPDEKSVGPEATILTYLSERPVYPPDVLAAVRADGPRFSRVFVPVGSGKKKFHEYDAKFQELVASGKVSWAEPAGAPTGGYQLSTLVASPGPATRP